MKNFVFILLIFQCLNFQATSQNIKMKGIMLDAITNAPIEFVNIGILNKNKGTITNINGVFTLMLLEKFQKDSLTISHINYHTIKTPIKNDNNLTIFLKPKTNKLEEVVISNKKKKYRKTGVKSYNPLLWLGAISKDNDIIENAQRIHIPDKTVKVKYVNMYLRRGFKSDSSFIRINFYKNVDNAPGDKIIFENIIQKKQIKPGWIKVDLTKNNIYIEEDFFIGVEFIPDFNKQLEVYLGCILTKGKGYIRRHSQGKWDKLQGASTINVEIEY